MSEYSYAPSRSHRTRDPGYVTETTYIERGGRGAPVRDLVYRGREDSIEDIHREFPPPGGEYRQTRYREEYGPPRRTRSQGRRDDYGYDVYDRDRYDNRDRRDYDDGYSDYSARPKPNRRKSIVNQIKDFGEAAGLGGVVGAIAGRKDRSRSRRRRDDRGYDSDRDYYGDRRRGSRSSSRNRGARKSEKWEQAAKAAIVAGAVEAFRSRKVPGAWTGAKGQRIATAALGAAGIDGLIDRNPVHHEKRHVIESALGGIAASHLANGSRSRSRPRGNGSRSLSRSRSRSRSIFGRSRSRGRSGSRARSDYQDGEKSHGNGLAKIASTGAVIAAGKALYDRVRSKSRSRKERSRSSSRDSFVPSRRGGRRSSSRGRGMIDDNSQSPNRTNPDHRLAVASGAGAGALAARDRGRGRRDSPSSSSTISDSTTDIEEERKKLKGKELLTAGLATVATIHAAHGVYSSMVASEKRRKLVGEGEMSPEEARKRKSKNMLQDAAAVGIAALGIKSAYSEWKEMNEQRHSVKELEVRRRKRRKQRERHERDARLNALSAMGNQEPHATYAYPVASTPVYPTYADANPYASMAPPPMGARY